MRLAVLGHGGAPGAGVSAVLLNVTAVDETAGTGYLTVFRTGSTRPLASTLNYRAPGGGRQPGPSACRP